MKTSKTRNRQFPSINYLKRIPLNLILICFILLSILPAVSGKDHEEVIPHDSAELRTKESKWKPVSTKLELEVYQRWIYLPGNRKTRERKGIFFVHNEVDEIVDLINNSEGIKLWMSAVKESHDLNNNDQWSSLIYILFQVPWPFSDKDLVAEITTIESNIIPVQKTVYYSAVQNQIPLNEDAERLLSYEATWVITSLESSLTKVEFTVFSDTPPVAPRWIQDPITIKLFKKNLLNLRELLLNLDHNALNAMNR